MAEDPPVTPVVKGLALIAAIALAILFGISKQRNMPANARLLVDEAAGEYFAPPCLADPPPRRGLVAITAAEARRRGHDPNPDCLEADGFVSESQTLLGSLLFPDKSRWNADGTWRY
jgi:hypothetical protein